VGRAILEVSKEQNVNLTVLGSYRRSPMMEVMLGSTVDHMLRKNQYPLLICR
jgi:nucleotide-binding universal stress UspA family protein